MRMQSGKRQRSQLAVAIAIMKAYALQKRIDKLAAASHPKVDLNQPPPISLQPNSTPKQES